MPRLRSLSWHLSINADSVMIRPICCVIASFFSDKHNFCGLISADANSRHISPIARRLIEEAGYTGHLGLSRLRQQLRVSANMMAAWHSSKLPVAAGRRTCRLRVNIASQPASATKDAHPRSAEARAIISQKLDNSSHGRCRPRQKPVSVK